jgi:hypothetical protein
VAKERYGSSSSNGKGNHSHFVSNRQYLEIKDKAKAIEQLYAESGLILPPTCDLANLIQDAKTLSDLWITAPDSIQNSLTFRAAFLSRIADAILPLVDVPDRSKYLIAVCFLD